MLLAALELATSRQVLAGASGGISHAGRQRGDLFIDGPRNSRRVKHVFERDLCHLTGARRHDTLRLPAPRQFTDGICAWSFSMRTGSQRLPLSEVSSRDAGMSDTRDTRVLKSVWRIGSGCRRSEWYVT